jgi:hypothetical protein
MPGALQGGDNRSQDVDNQPQFVAGIGYVGTNKRVFRGALGRYAKLFFCFTLVE